MQRVSHPTLLLSIGFLLLVVAAFFLMPMDRAALAAPEAPSLSANAPASVNRCAGFDVTLRADFGTSQGGGWETDLGYDSTKLVYDKVTPTTWLSNGGTRDVGLLGPIHSLGTLALGQYSYKTTEGVTGAGDVATVRFLAAGAGTANFTLSQAQFADPAANGTTPAMNGDSIQINDVANCAPSIIPGGGQNAQTGYPGTSPQWFTITTTYRDLDGEGSFHGVAIMLRNPNNRIVPFFGFYSQPNNALYVYDTGQTPARWIGGKRPGEPSQKIWTYLAGLDPEGSSVSLDPAAKTLTVNWKIMLRAGSPSPIPNAWYYKNLFARDMKLATSGWVNAGYVVVTNP